MTPSTFVSVLAVAAVLILAWQVIFQGRAWLVGVVPLVLVMAGCGSVVYEPVNPVQGGNGGTATVYLVNGDGLAMDTTADGLTSLAVLPGAEVELSVRDAETLKGTTDSEGKIIFDLGEARRGKVGQFTVRYQGKEYVKHVELTGNNKFVIPLGALIFHGPATEPDVQAAAFSNRAAAAPNVLVPLAPSRTPLLRQSFEGGSDRWALGSEKGAHLEMVTTFEEGKLRCRGLFYEAGRIARLPVPVAATADLSVAFDVEIEEAAPGGTVYTNLFLRQTAVDSYLLVRFSSDGMFSATRYERGTAEKVVDWATAEAIRRGAGVVNRYEVSVRGRALTIRANGTLIAEATIAALPAAGEVALGVDGQTGQNVHVAFDNLEVLALNQ